MPKVAYLGTAPRRDPIKDAIRGQQRLMRMSNAEAGALLNISREAYGHRMNHVHTDDWYLRDILTLWRKLGLPIDELRASVRF